VASTGGPYTNKDSNKKRTNYVHIWLILTGHSTPGKKVIRTVVKSTKFHRGSVNGIGKKRAFLCCFERTGIVKCLPVVKEIRRTQQPPGWKEAHLVFEMGKGTKRLKKDKAGRKEKVWSITKNAAQLQLGKPGLLRSGTEEGEGGFWAWNPKMPKGKIY